MTSTTVEKRQFLNSLEWHDIDTNKEFYDEIGHRFFVNACTQPIRVGFGHNTRCLEIIAITENLEGEEELQTLEGEEIFKKD